MGWAAIITALLQIFGPMLAEWLKQWLDSWLNKAAARMGDAVAYGDDAARTEALLTKAIDMLPFWALARKSLLRRMRAIDTRAITQEEKDEFIGLAELAANE